MSRTNEKMKQWRRCQTSANNKNLACAPYCHHKELVTAAMQTGGSFNAGIIKKTRDAVHVKYETFSWSVG